MARGRSTVKVFVDSSVLFTAVNSPTGGSAKLFTLEQVQLETSKVVLGEVERNVKKKLHSYHLERLFLLVDQMVVLGQLPSEVLIERARGMIVEKDAVILAEAKQARSDFLVTLDKKHFLQPAVSKFLKPKKVVTPKMLLEMGLD